MKGRFRVASETHRFGEMCLTKCIGSSGLIGLGLAVGTLRRCFEACLSSLVLVELSELLKGAFAFEVGWIPAGLLPEFMGFAPDALTLLSL